MTKPEREGGNDLNLDQLEYARRLEERYARRIEDLLTPVWVRAASARRFRSIWISPPARKRRSVTNPGRSRAPCAASNCWRKPIPG
ncbi:MAG: hypothetical protein MZV70_44025 [Desulfobacterales bacterium]|nr:hypothetical protein [Desulfobacterales bacterium]